MNHFDLSNSHGHRQNLPRYTVSKRLMDQGTMQIQALRSASPWSTGVAAKENSIYECYLDLISNARDFIYLENQFFMSSYSPDDAESETNEHDILRNRIAKALYSRILRAHKQKQKFKVFIFIPLLPAAKRNFDEADEANLLKVLMHQQNMTLGLATHSLIKMIRNNITNNYEDYLMICSLRKYEVIPEFLKKKNPTKENWAYTELIYIHSKVSYSDGR